MASSKIFFIARRAVRRVNRDIFAYLGIVLISIFCATVFHLTQVFADNTSPPPCPEAASLKASSSLIGGNVWNPFTGWLYNQSTPTDGSVLQGVKKKALGAHLDGTTLSNGADIYGWTWSPTYGYVCWGASCGTPPSGSTDATDIFERVQNNNQFCANPGAQGCLTPPPPASGSPAIMLDYADAQRMCITSDHPEGSVCTDPMTPPAYCTYPVTGWMKIRTLKENGWVSLNGTINNTQVPTPLPQETGLNWTQWTGRIDCTVIPPPKTDQWYQWYQRCHYGVMYNPNKKEFTGWGWNTKMQWFAFSGSTLSQTGADYNNSSVCGASCASISYSTGKSIWNTSYIGAWVYAVGGSIFSVMGFGEGGAPPSRYNTDYLVITNSSVSGGSGVGVWKTQCDEQGTKGALQNKNGVSQCVSVTRNKKESSDQLPSLTETLPKQPVKEKGVARNGLGTLNVTALLPDDPVNQLIGTTLTNQGGKGMPVKKIGGESDIWGPRLINGQIGYQLDNLGGKIYYYNGDLAIGDGSNTWYPKLPNNADGSNAAFTIVVKGNIIIKRPIVYDSTPTVTNFKGLASIAWVALNYDTPKTIHDPGMPDNFVDATWNAGGNIVIDNCLPNIVTTAPGYDSSFNEDEELYVIKKSQQMTTVAGTFFAQNVFATGSGSSGDSHCMIDSQNKISRFAYPYTVTAPVTSQTGPDCGLVSGTLTKDASGQKMCSIQEYYRYDVPLTIDGIVIAKKFQFERAYKGVNVASETISDTGRLFVNPPPGFAEFSKGLPLW